MTTPALDLDLLRTFVAIADHTSFAEAGRHLGRTQASVTQHMQRLEQQVGVALLRKQGRQKSLPMQAVSCCATPGRCSRSTTRHWPACVTIA